MKCIKCGQEDESKFFKPRNEIRGRLVRHGTEMNICKDCLESMIDASKPETFDFVLKQLDVPFIDDFYWHKFDMWKERGDSDVLILAKYLAFMNLLGNACFTYEDADRINEEDRRREKETVEERMERVRSISEKLRQEGMIQ